MEDTTILKQQNNDSKPFWNPSYDELTTKLLLPIEIDPEIILIQRKYVEKPFISKKLIKVQDKILNKTYFQLNESIVVKKWQDEETPDNLLKSLKIKLKVNAKQRQMFNEWFNTSNYVYNKTISCINNYDKSVKKTINFIELRDKFVTENTMKNNVEYITLQNNMKLFKEEKKNQQKMLLKIPKNDTVNIDKVKLLIQTAEEKYQEENEKFRIEKKSLKSSKNIEIREWETNTPKDIREGAVKDVVTAHKSAVSNIREKNIKHFHLGFRKKKEPNKCLLLSSKLITNKNGILTIAKTYLKGDSKISMGKKTIKRHRNLVIEHDCRLVKQKNIFWVIIPISVEITDKKIPVNYCGIDPGVKTFMTSFGNNGCVEHKHNEKILKDLDNKIKLLKDRRRTKQSRVHKKQINMLEIRKGNLVDELHWKTINRLLKMNDFIFYGDIKSHGIVKNRKNHTLNTDVNNLKFYKFKQRLLFKAIERGKKVYETKEHYTTQTCSFCGSMYRPGLSRVYDCKNCEKNIGRDVNAAKNILMKGILTHLY